MPEAAPRYPVRIEPNVWLEMDDGVRLAATLYLPDAPNDGPFPALLESIPYRKDDWTLSRDRPLHVSFAEARVRQLSARRAGDGDLAGDRLGRVHGARDRRQRRRAGLAGGPALDRAERRGCSASAGAGSRALQAAMRRPPSLRAIVPVHFSHDRYTTDVHYYGGTLHVGESIYWPAGDGRRERAPARSRVGRARLAGRLARAARADSAVAVRMAPPPAPRCLLAAWLGRRGLGLDRRRDPRHRRAPRRIPRCGPGSARACPRPPARRHRPVGPHLAARRAGQRPRSTASACCVAGGIAGSETSPTG